MAAISTAGIRAEWKLFHNEKIRVYPTELHLDRISYWKENNRTIFTFEVLVQEKGKTLEELSLEEIVKFISEQEIHKLQTLADSIGRNGVQVPLIIRDDGKLLDGNRRFFACHLLKMQQKKKKNPEPEALKSIPVLVIRKSDITDIQELKILAEANFIQDLKVAWPLDAQARAVNDYFESCMKRNGKDRDAAFEEISGVFGISKKRADDLIDALRLTKKFISEGDTKAEQMRRRAIVEEKFVYLWEFRNKAMQGRGALSEGTELTEVRDLFFSLMAKGKDSPIKNVKQIEPLIQARRDKAAWNLLVASKGTKLNQVVSIVNEKKAFRKAEDKIQVFLDWLTEEKENFSVKSKSLLRQLAKVALERAKE